MHKLFIILIILLASLPTLADIMMPPFEERYLFIPNLNNNSFISETLVTKITFFLFFNFSCFICCYFTLRNSLQKNKVHHIIISLIISSIIGIFMFMVKGNYINGPISFFCFLATLAFCINGFLIQFVTTVICHKNQFNSLFCYYAYHIPRKTSSYL